MTSVKIPVNNTYREVVGLLPVNTRCDANIISVEQATDDALSSLIVLDVPLLFNEKAQGVINVSPETLIALSEEISNRVNMVTPMSLDESMLAELSDAHSKKATSGFVHVNMPTVL